MEIAVLVLVCQQKLSEWDPRIREPRHAEPVGSPCVLDVPFDPGEEKRAASKGPAAQMLEEPPELPQGRNLLGWGGCPLPSEDEYRSELERLRLELERLSPNLKASRSQPRGPYSFAFHTLPFRPRHLFRSWLYDIDINLLERHLGSCKASRKTCRSDVDCTERVS